MIALKSSIMYVFYNRVNGILENNGHSVVFHVNSNQEESESLNSISSGHNPSSSHSSSSTINISGGPLSYSYSFHSLHLHFGRTDATGSEHTIAGLAFPGEVSNCEAISCIERTPNLFRFKSWATTTSSTTTWVRPRPNQTVWSPSPSWYRSVSVSQRQSLWKRTDKYRVQKNLNITAN